MRSATGQPVRLSDYQQTDYIISHVDMDIRLDPEETIVITTYDIAPREPGAAKPLVLDGDELKLDFVCVNGRDIAPSAFDASPDKLTLHKPPQEAFKLQITTRVNPTTNTQLMGLYRSSETYCTQCEAEGFRRITYSLDRPDVLATYRTRIEAPKREAEYLLSNGNRVDGGPIAGTDRHFAVWEDPHPKPSYLFALVAGHLAKVSDTFTTISGREVVLEIFVEHGKEHLCDWAMDSLKRSMRWDEENYGCEYDLDIFMIVAVSDFNMGAMENKGLNIFNDKYVLADPEVATDQDYANIEAIIAHEYFHNWTGNRITCRDWFQLCLKEGLTVFRDQEFSSDERSRPVKRIADVKLLKNQQFPEDAGPLAHPVRPDEYHEINNFYTATVYEKGAEVVRMLHTLAGAEGYRKATDLYFERHDGEAATVEDWLKVFEDSLDKDLEQFAHWYAQAGTPQLMAEGEYDAKGSSYSLKLTQITPPTPGQSTKDPLHIPVRFGLVGEDGADTELTSITGGEVDGDVLHLTGAEQVFKFDNIKGPVVPSLLRGFSAPVRLTTRLSEDEKLHLMAHDSDPFNRWQAGQTLATDLLIRSIKGKPVDTGPYIEALEKSLENDELEPAFRAQMLALPSDGMMAQEIGENVDPDAIFSAIGNFKDEIVSSIGDTLLTLANKRIGEAYKPDAQQSGSRMLKNYALDFISGRHPDGALLTEAQYMTADNMTDRLAALASLTHHCGDKAKKALSDFDSRYRMNALVMDKWFALQAVNPVNNALENVRTLMRHPSFDITNPNRVRSLVGAFAANNLTQFNRQDGLGYEFIASFILDLDGSNAQLAASIMTTFRSWKLLEPMRRTKAQAALQRIADTTGLSPDTRDIVTRTLA